MNYILVCVDSYLKFFFELSVWPIGPDSWSRNGNPSENCPIVSRPPGTQQMAMDNHMEDEHPDCQMRSTQGPIVKHGLNLYLLN